MLLDLKKNLVRELRPELNCQTLVKEKTKKIKTKIKKQT